MSEANIEAVQPGGILVSPSQSPAIVFLASLSLGSRRAMRDALGLIVRLIAGETEADPVTFEWERLRFQHTAAIRAKLVDLHSPAYCRKIVAALRGVLRAAWRLGLMPTDDYHRAIDLEPIRGSRVDVGRELPSVEIRKLFAAATADPYRIRGVRDGAILALGFGFGLRRAEIASACTSDFDLATQTMTVVGKGNKQRAIPGPLWAVAAVQAWVSARNGSGGALLISRLDSSEGLTPQTVYMAVKGLAVRAGVSLYPHEMRKTLASQLLDASGDLATVSRMLGHASPATTMRYDKRAIRAARAAVDRLADPTKEDS